VAIAPRVHRVGKEIVNSYFVGDAMATPPTRRRRATCASGPAGAA
jgi:hypothetical protein